MLVIVFRSRPRPDHDEAAAAALGEHMYELAVSMPGFISYKDFSSADGEFVTVVEFESAETLAAWRSHPEHVEAQRRGREEFFSEYQIQVCAPIHAYRFDRERGRRELH